MNGGVKAALLISCLGIVGCTTSRKEVQVRAIADPSAALSRGGDEIAVARGQLALGNVGLALEGFRKARRDYPTDAAPLQGIGDCYAVMGRFDLAQSSYEAALALAPHDRRLLLGLAAIFEREGDLPRAAQARADADRALQSVAPAVTAVAQADAAAPPQLAQQPGSELHMSPGSVTVELPPVRPAERLEAHSGASPLPPVEDFAPPSSSVTVALPPARLAPSASAVATAVRRTTVTHASAPRLERLSSGEVALLTSGKPIWRAQGEGRTSLASAVRWAALSPTDGRPNVQVLNAAQSHGIAASARTVLLNRGWRRIAIGNAPALQQKSVVLYPRNRAKLGRSLAAQFGVSARMVERDILVLVLGRDAVERITGQQKS
jgi:tetratricopeptide (TPR) repeat protein